MDGVVTLMMIILVNVDFSGNRLVAYWLGLTRSGSTKPSLQFLLPVFMAEDRPILIY